MNQSVCAVQGARVSDLEDRRLKAERGCALHTLHRWLEGQHVALA